MRDRTTFEKIDQYLVIFDSPFALRKSRQHLEHLMRLSEKFTMTDLMHPKVPPQEGFSVHGEKFDKLVKSFSLVPPGSKVHSNHDTTLPAGKAQVVHDGGYGGIVDKYGNRRPAVLLRVVGIKEPTSGDIVQAILSDGEVRNVHWNIIHDFPFRL